MIHKCVVPEGTNYSLIAFYQKDFLCIPECKNGPTQMVQQHRRLDLLCIRRSWTAPGAVGYEVKVSRQDFQKDNKWQDYLPMCSELFFATPPKLILPHEVPDPCGLKWVYDGRPVTKKKAAVRQIDWHIPTLLYILICRARVEPEAVNYRDAQRDFWKKWVEKKKVDMALGWHVRENLRRRIDEEVEAQRRANKYLRERVEQLEHIEQVARAAGVTHWNRDPEIVARIKRYLDPAAQAVEMLKQAEEALHRARQQAQELIGKEELRGEEGVQPVPVLAAGEEDHVLYQSGVKPVRGDDELPDDLPAVSGTGAGEES